MKVTFPDSLPIMALLEFAEWHGLKACSNRSGGIEFRPKDSDSNVLEFPKPAPAAPGPSAA